MRKVLLVPVSEKADKIIEQFGEIWEIHKQERGCPTPTSNEGEWIFVKPYLSTKVTKSKACWIDLNDDGDFMVEHYDN